MDIEKPNERQLKKGTLFVATGTHGYDALLQAIDNPSYYEALLKNSFNRIIFQCPHKDYFQPMFHKSYADRISIEIYGPQFPPDVFLYKADLAITNCDVAVLLESHPVKVNTIVLIEDTNSICYEIFSILSKKPNMIGLKGTKALTSEFGSQSIPGEHQRPPFFNEEDNRQLILLKDKLLNSSQRFQGYERKLAAYDERKKNESKLYLDFLNLAFDSKKLNQSLMQHPQFKHIEPILKKSDFITFQKQMLFSNNGLRENSTFKIKEEISQEEDYNTKPKEGENEEDYFERIRQNYNPYFYFDKINYELKGDDAEDDEEEEDGDEVQILQTIDQQNGETNQQKQEGQISRPNQNGQNEIHSPAQNGQQINGAQKKLSLSEKYQRNRIVYNTDFSKLDPIQMLKKQDVIRAQEVHIKQVEKNNNHLNELVSSIERKEIVQMIKDEYENKTIKGCYRICNCPYCKRLLVPFLVRKDFDRCHQELNDLVLQKHRLYFEKVIDRYKITDFAIQEINNIFFREYKTSFISLSSQMFNPSKLQNDQYPTLDFKNKFGEQSIESIDNLNLKPSGDSINQFFKSKMNGEGQQVNGAQDGKIHREGGDNNQIEDEEDDDDDDEDDDDDDDEDDEEDNANKEKSVPIIHKAIAKPPKD